MPILERSFGHWDPAYVLSRTAEMIYRRRNADLPWLTSTANSLLPHLLRSSDVGLEWGSGRSTIWFAQRIAHLTSVEHNAGWYERVSDQLRSGSVSNVEYMHVAARDEVEPVDDVSGEPYVRVSDRFADGTLDFALVDGVYRSACALAVLPKLRCGGLLVIDNANWFLPNRSASPSSRSEADGPSSGDWKAFLSRVKGWRHIWTTSGVTDTALWIKPC
jgi:hypothetical protein